MTPLANCTMYCKFALLLLPPCLFFAWQFLRQIFDTYFYLYKHKSANITFVGGVLLFSVKWRYVTLDFTDNPIWKLFTTHKIVHGRENLRSILSASKILCRLVFLLNRIKLSRKRLLHFSNRFKLKLQVFSTSNFKVHTRTLSLGVLQLTCSYRSAKKVHSNDLGNLIS